MPAHASRTRAPAPSAPPSRAERRLLAPARPRHRPADAGTPAELSASPAARPVKLRSVDSGQAVGESLARPSTSARSCCSDGIDSASPVRPPMIGDARGSPGWGRRDPDSVQSARSPVHEAALPVRVMCLGVEHRSNLNCSPSRHRRSQPWVALRSWRPVASSVAGRRRTARGRAGSRRPARRGCRTRTHPRSGHRGR